MIGAKGEIAKLCLLSCDGTRVLIRYQPTGLGPLLGLSLSLRLGFGFGGFLFLVCLMLRAKLSDAPVNILWIDFCSISETPAASG